MSCNAAQYIMYCMFEVRIVTKSPARVLQIRWQHEQRKRMLYKGTVAKDYRSKIFSFSPDAPIWAWLTSYDILEKIVRTCGNIRMQTSFPDMPPPPLCRVKLFCMTSPPLASRVIMYHTVDMRIKHGFALACLQVSDSQAWHKAQVLNPWHRLPAQFATPLHFCNPK